MQSLQTKRKYWHHHVRAWRESGLSRAAYCTLHGLKLHALVYWIRRERAQTGSLTLVPAVLSPAPNVSGDDLVLRGPCGWQLHVPADVSPGWLAELMGRLA